jgi:hypothetical protein
MAPSVVTGITGGPEGAVPAAGAPPCAAARSGKIMAKAKVALRNIRFS